MYAVVNIGGKQAKVETGSVVTVEKLSAEVGETVSLPVLMLADGETVLAKPAEIASAHVSAEVLEHFKGEKQIVFKFKKRKGYKRTKGHRQELTSVKIVEIARDGAPKAAKAAKPKAEAAPKSEAPKAEAPKAAKPKAAAPKPEAAPKSEAPKAAKPKAAKPAVDEALCAAVKSDGTQCANKPKDGSKYCGVHAKKYEG